MLNQRIPINDDITVSLDGVYPLYGSVPSRHDVMIIRSNIYDADTYIILTQDDARKLRDALSTLLDDESDDESLAAVHDAEEYPDASMTVEPPKSE